MSSYYLCMRTDKPEAEIYVYDENGLISQTIWEAHRQLAETLHTVLENTLEQAGITMEQLNGIVCYRGPGSFTGLRIGMSVANALSYSLEVPIVGESGDSWIKVGIDKLCAGETQYPAQLEYGAPVHITAQKK